MSSDEIIPKLKMLAGMSKGAFDKNIFLSIRVIDLGLHISVSHGSRNIAPMHRIFSWTELKAMPPDVLEMTVKKELIAKMEKAIKDAREFYEQAQRDMNAIMAENTKDYWSENNGK
jgi:hypothetical protein